MKLLKAVLDIDPTFWAIVPAFNLNFHERLTLEIEWLCFGLYISKYYEQ